MGTLTLADFRTDIQGAMQRSGVSNTLLDKWTNQGIEEIAYGLVRFKELQGIKTFSTIANQASYGITTDLAMTDFRAINQYGLRKTAPSDRLGKLIPESRVSYLQKLGDATDTTQYGEIRYYHKYGSNIYFRPIPDAELVTVDMHYWKKITKLVNVGDTSQFDEDWDDAIFLAALYRGMRYFGEYDRWQNVQANMVAMVRSRMMEEDIEEFPEGGISAVGFRDDESVLIDGNAGNNSDGADPDDPFST